jgi:uncharacterized protein with PQ loop repeat
MEIAAQILGYLASVLLALSLIVTNDIKFRWLNTMGCLSFIVYGILINAFPIILTNSILLVINLYYLVKIYRAEEDFELFEFKGDEKLIHKFLSFHKTDIANYFPDYVHDDKEGKLRFVILRDLVIANIFVADLTAEGTAIVQLNYTAKRYRDYKVGKFIFNRENRYLISKGVQQIYYKEVKNKNHQKFLRVMGFKQQADGSHVKQVTIDN